MLYGRSRADPGLVMGAEVEAPQTPRGVGFGEGVSPSPTGEGSGEGAVPPPQKFCLILDHEIAFLAHSGRYILQFSCLLYAQNPAIYM